MFDKRDTDEINGLYTDFRSDVIAAVAVDDGFDADSVIVKRRLSPDNMFVPAEGTGPQTDKEISAVEYREDYEDEGRDLLFIKTNRPGIYDNLPEGLFHSSASLNNRSEEAVVSYIRRQHRDEIQIRRFFSLFEAETERSRIDIRLAELHYDRPVRHRAYAETVGHFWPVINRMDSLTAMLFVRTIPTVARIRGNYAEIAQALTTILGYPVCIVMERRAIETAINLPRLGAMRLGLNAVLKGVRTIAVARVIIEAPERAIDSLVPSEQMRGIVETLLGIYLPDGVDYIVDLRPAQRIYTARFGGRLGINLKLKENNINESSKQ